MSWSQILDLLESGLLRRREVGSLLVHAFTLITHIFFLTLDFLVFSVSLLVFLIFFLFLSFFRVPSLLFIVHVYSLLYCLLWQDLSFLPLKYFWFVMGVLPEMPTGLSIAQPPPLHYVGCIMPYSQTKVVFVLFSNSFCTLIRIRAGFLSYQPL